MNETIELSKGCLSSRGRNTLEAKAKLEAQISIALAGDYRPLLIIWRGYAGLGYRTPSGWHSSVVKLEDYLPIDISYSVKEYSPDTTREMVLDDLNAHLAELGYRPEDGFTIPAILQKPELQNQYLYKRSFIWLYTKFRAMGLSDEAAFTEAYWQLRFPNPLLLALI